MPTPYTVTYADIDGGIADNTDILEEFTAIEDAIESFRASYQDGGGSDTSTVYVSDVVVGSTTIVDPTNGAVQSLLIGDVDSVAITIAEHQTGDTFRLYVVARFVRADTTFTVAAQHGHIFALNAASLIPSQVANNGYYAAVIIVTFTDTGTFLQVYSDNTEATAADVGDFLTAKAL